MKTTSEEKSIKKITESEFKKSDIFILLSIGTFVFLVWFLLPQYMNWVFKDDDTFDMKGKFGDMYNVVTSLFSATTIILLVYTILQQRKDLAFAAQALHKQQEELELNREELKLNRDELKLTRKEFKTQNKTLKYQRFEITLFNMINLHHEIVRGMIDQRVSFLRFIRMIEGHVTNSIPDIIHHLNVIEKYDLDANFGHYISNFRVIINFILKRKKLEPNRIYYLNIYFSQITMNEKILLLYYFNLNKSKENWKYLTKMLFSDINKLPHNHLSILEGTQITELLNGDAP